MTNTAPPKFSSTKEEIEYWRKEADQYKQGRDDAKQELDEFQSSSHELEAELEAQLTTVENKNRELVATNSKQSMEIEMLREKCDKQHLSSHRQITELETKLSKVEAYTEALQKYIRELEQTNDDLERAKRAVCSSLEDFEARMNQALERNAFLESELDEKEDLVVVVQRLKDEARDRRHEMAASSLRAESNDISVSSSTDAQNRTTTTGQQSTTGQQTARRRSRPEIGSNASTPTTASSAGGVAHVTASLDSVQSPSTPTRRTSILTVSESVASPLNGSLTNGTRVSALNIVGDLLRKVVALESKLSTCRNVVFTAPGAGEQSADGWTRVLADRTAPGQNINGWDKPGMYETFKTLS